MTGQMELRNIYASRSKYHAALDCEFITHTAISGYFF